MSTFAAKFASVCLAFGLGAVVAATEAPRAADEARLAFFEQRIRPVLVEHCYECHSTESQKLKGGLRLDFRDGLLRGGDTRAAVVPGKAAESLLVTALSYTNRDLQMPPKGKLPDAVIADLVKWVNDGAADPRTEPTATVAAKKSDGAGHWAFQPIRDVAPPVVDSTAAASSPLDRFIGAKLAEHGLSPAPAADRRTLIRRATYDLTGLPPTPEEIAAFLADEAPGAFSRLVERLLASPRYGERWGRWWLDVARYADTNGQDENKVMANAWRYRDWVIRSFNANQPFDSFLTEQLAGDLLPTHGVGESAVFDRWTATGFLVLGPKMLAEQDKPKLVMDLVDEQIEVVSRAFLGLTVGCARCHDHKFDPISARDYYALAGIFKSTKTMENLAFVSKFNERRITGAAELRAIETHAAALTAASNAVTKATQQANAALTESWRTNLTAYLAATAEVGPVTSLASNLVVRLRELVSSNPVTNSVSRTLRQLAADPASVPAFLARGNDPGRAKGLRLAPGKFGAAFRGTGKNHLELPSSDALEPAQLTVEAWVRATEFPKDGDARRWLAAKNANEWAEGHYALMLDRDRPGAYLNLGGGRENVFALWASQPLKSGQWHHLAFTYDEKTLRLYVDGQPAGHTEINRPRKPGSGPLALGRRPDGHVNFRGDLDEARVLGRALTAAEVKARFEQPTTNMAPDVVAAWDFNDLSTANRDALALDETYDALFGNEGVFTLLSDPRPLYPAETRASLAALERQRDDLKSRAPATAAFALAVEEDKPVDLPVHIRGSHLNLAKEPVPRGFIQVANRAAATTPPKDHSGRLELAGWLTSPDNPLTARVIVNRIWQAHFGEGLVRTPDNFGLRGETPSHPELLDWLAREFLRSGWDVKHLHRLILGSATWQQASEMRNAEFGMRDEAARVGAQPIPQSAFRNPHSEDPDNRLLAHFPRQRLEAEMVRDALLAVSGRLEATSGGTLVNWKNDDYTPTDDVSAASTRRSVYLPIVRDRVFDVFTIFDFANPSVGTSKRSPTVVSHQALFFLNSPLVKSSARALAETLLAELPHDQDARIQLAYERAFGRPPTEPELQRTVRFIASATRGAGLDSDLAAWTAWCQALFAANEFLYRE
jgi:hypothetical protein